MNTDSLNDRPTLSIEHDPMGAFPTSHTVVTAVARALGTEPLSLQPPLYDAVDPDALDLLFESVSDEESGEVTVTFDYLGCDVTITTNRVTVVQDST